MILDTRTKESVMFVKSKMIEAYNILVSLIGERKAGWRRSICGIRRKGWLATKRTCDRRLATGMTGDRATSDLRRATCGRATYDREGRPATGRRATWRTTSDLRLDERLATERLTTAAATIVDCDGRLRLATYDRRQATGDLRQAAGDGRRATGDGRLATGDGATGDLRQATYDGQRRGLLEPAPSRGNIPDFATATRDLRLRDGIAGPAASRLATRLLGPGLRGNEHRRATCERGLGLRPSQLARRATGDPRGE